MPDFLPRRDAELLGWARNFRDKIVASAQAYGLDPQQAADFSDKVDVFAADYQAVASPSTRTRSATVRKDGSRAAMKQDARRLAAIARAHPGVSGEQRIELGLSLREERRTRGGRPRTVPQLVIRSATGHTVTLRIRNGQSGKRGGRAEGLAGAAVFSYTGEQPPGRRSQWSLRGFATRGRFNVRLESDTAPGSRVWLSACWLSAALRRGPACTPILTNIAGGPAGPVAADLLAA
ncbi:MAG: hypothetical protein ABIP55_00775 [Tepidisphaeraceae bacterium]